MKHIGRLIKKKLLWWIAGTIGVSGAFFIGLAFCLMMIFVTIMMGGGGKIACDPFQIGNISPHVKKYEPLVSKYAEELDIEEYTPLILAIMQQESGGNPNEKDPMQSSESLCGEKECITNPKLSIAQGVHYFNQMLQSASGDVFLALQSYNFGLDFIRFVIEQRGVDAVYEFNVEFDDGKATYDLAIEYSQIQYKIQVFLGNGHLYKCSREEAKRYGACYGDILYVWAVLNYVEQVEGCGVDLPTRGIGSGIPNAQGWVKPLVGNYPITSGFGWRDLGFGPEFHKGIDFGAPTGTPVYAAKEGMVIYVVPAAGPYPDSFGSVIFIDHGGGVVSIYAHLSATHVRVGQTVEQNQHIGNVGSTGRSTGPHLHFEVRVNNQSTNPLPLIQ
ncbi:lysozyme family protein [Metasolibacillus meyeri]|uniref:Lysozyme family protein n=1 Tax=Metasolibacillus meyeri TaxID=1071052 RepID=A0AAW9NQY5_9BACL|nr:lysozyme family protein [Metasolibacillus meyeri]MEC1177258.1 lysozyme family protein [Metasolibacillus meyeri]